jgi:hypothetical protein
MIVQIVAMVITEKERIRYVTRVNGAGKLMAKLRWSNLRKVSASDKDKRWKESRNTGNRYSTTGIIPWAIFLLMNNASGRLQSTGKRYKGLGCWAK